MKILYNCLEFTLQCIAPDYCRVCRQRSDPGRPVCLSCIRRLPRVTHPCPRCGLPETDGRVCGRCQGKPPAFDQTIAAFRYAEPVSSIICTLKYAGDVSAARPLGLLLADCVAARGRGRPDILMPVPLHTRRIMKRGFNQSIEIARVTAKRLKIPLSTGAVRRARHTAAQQTLSLSERRRNVRECFDVVRPPRVRRIALVDDVMTSGATMDALAAALKRHGDYEVQAWVCARA